MEPNHYWLSILLIGFVILPKGDVIRPPIHLWNSDHDPSKNWQFPKIVHDSAWWGFGILGVAISLSESFHHPLLMGFYFSFTLPAVVPFLRKAFWAIALIGFFWQSIAFESVSVDWGAYLYLLFLWNPQWLKPSKDTADQLNIVFFDGDCLICNRSVRFLMREDRLRQLKFAPLQGNTFKRFYPEMATDLDFDSMVFSPHSENPSASPKQRTSAIAAMLMAMGGFWRVIGILLFLIPTPIRDLGYNLIAQNRYRWFGKTKTFCEMPKQEDISRLLD